MFKNSAESVCLKTISDPILNEVINTHGCLTISEFTDLITIAEMTLGPIAVSSATFVGVKIAGIPGALIAKFGCILPSCIIVSLLFYIYNRYKNISVMQGVLSYLRPVIVVAIASAGFSILQNVVFIDGILDIKNLNLILF